MSKKIVWIVLAVVIVGGGIWWWSMSQGTNEYASTSPTSTSSEAQIQNSDSDQSIDQSMANINAQMNGLSSDSASINQGLNDQPVQQSQF